jgi:hypothetical protein
LYQIHFLWKYPIRIHFQIQSQNQNLSLNLILNQSHYPILILNQSQSQSQSHCPILYPYRCLVLYPYPYQNQSQQQYRQALQFLTPTGRFETHKYFEPNGPFFGEVHLADRDQNYFGDMRDFKLLTRFVRTSPSPTWRGVTYNRQIASTVNANRWSQPKFEVYSLGFE